MRIRTERLVLEPVTAEVARAVVDGTADAPAAAKGWPGPETLDALRLALEHDGDAGWFIVRDGVVVGECGTHGPPDSGGVVEIRYGVASSARGAGVASEACAGLTDALLARPGVRAVAASTSAAGNPASRRVLERCGFVPDRVEASTVWWIRARSEEQGGRPTGVR